MKGIIMCCVAMLPAFEIAGCTQRNSLPPVTINSPAPMPAPQYPAQAAKPAPTGPLFTTPPTIAIEPSNPWKPEAEVRDWEYIVIHHTASSSGSVESIHELHSKKKDKSGNSWLGIGYHFVIGNGGVQGLPQIRILDRFFIRCFPAVPLPVVDPAGDTLAHILGVGMQVDMAALVERIERLDCGHQLHAIVGGHGLATAQLLFRTATHQQCPPAARAGITPAGAIGINRNLFQVRLLSFELDSATARQKP